MKKLTHKIDPSEYTKKYYLDYTYSGSKQYKEGLHRPGPTVRHIYERIPATENHKSFLDAGCGKGELLLFMKQKGYDVFGIDYSYHAVRVARELAKKFHITAAIKRGDVRETGFRGGKFDIVTSTDVVEHLDDNKAVVDFFNESYRILKKGGHLYLHTAPNADFVKYFQKYYLRYIDYICIKTINFIFGKHIPISLDLRSDYNKRFHINEQTYASLLDNIRRSKFTNYSIELFGDPYEFSIFKLPYYIFAYWYPINKVFPFSKFLANHIYLTAEK